MCYRQDGNLKQILIKNQNKMSKEISFFIVKLDEGYTLTEKNKTKALEFSKNVEDYLVQRFLKEIERFAHTGVPNMQINISIEENIPQCADR